jgi:predicted house-cleaning NTP pyrophosphatase (Maf/HAM1 superfamily)
MHQKTDFLPPKHNLLLLRHDRLKTNVLAQAATNLTRGNRGNGGQKENLCSFRFLVLNVSKLFLCAAALALGILGHTTAQAQSGGVPLWTNRYDGPANGYDSAGAMAVDGSGNVFVTGFSTGSGGEYVYATIAYSGAGVALWTNRYNRPGNCYDVATAVAVDGSGNVFVTGSSTGSGSGQDYATIAYSGAGVALWTNRYNGPGNSDDYANAVAVDGSGNVFVTGNSAGSGSGLDYATIKYSGVGVPLWTNRYNGPANGDDGANGVAVDGSGNVFVTGNSSGDYATIKYSGAGVPLWTNRYNGPGNGNDAAGPVAVDGSGNVFVTGVSEQTAGSFVFDYATIKYSGEGVPLWTNRYNGPGNDDDQATAVAVDGSGNVFVTGYSTGSGSGQDYATIAYSGAGVALWTNRYNGPGNSFDVAKAMAVDRGGNVIVTGNSRGSGGNDDYATIAYSGAGVPMWTNRYDRAGNFYDLATAVAVDGSGNVLVTGRSGDGGVGYDYATIKYSSAIPPALTVARKTTNTVAVSWPSPSTGFTLQQNTNGIATVNWSNVVATPSDDGTTRKVIVDPASGNRFYRLVHP